MKKKIAYIILFIILICELIAYKYQYYFINSFYYLFINSTIFLIFLKLIKAYFVSSYKINIDKDIQWLDKNTIQIKSGQYLINNLTLNLN